MSFRFARLMDRLGVSRRKLRGGRFHRWMGDHMFSKELWLLHRESVAWGWLIGCLTATTPFLGFQMLMALPFVFIFRANILVTFGLIWATNPLTAPVLYAAALILGNKLLGHETADLAFWRDAENLNLSPELITQFGFDIFGALLLGTSLIGLALGIPGFILIRMFWPDPKPRAPRGGRNPSPPGRPGSSGGDEPADGKVMATGSNP